MSKPRSYQQHKRFFGLVEAAFNHWPEGHPFKPKDSEHLRHWLLCAVNHSTIKTFETEGDATAIAKLLPIVVAIMTKTNCWTKAVGNEVQVCVPKSISYEEVSHQEFQGISNVVGDIIQEVIGIEPDTLLAESEKAA